MKKILASIMAAAVMISCMAAPAMARENFSDLPATHWAYTDVMKVADAGIIEGTGNNMFSPNMTLSADQFLTMVGRACYADDITRQYGDTWATPYIRAAKANGVLTGTTITDANVSQGITRYDMAVILTNVGKNVIGATGSAAASSKINDYGEIPAEYTDAVLWAYGNGLLKGDGKGNFDGAATMTRAMAATVISRLMALQASQKITAVQQIVAGPKEPVTPAPGEKTAQFIVFGTAECHSKPMTNNPVTIYLYYTERQSMYAGDGILLAKTTVADDGTYRFDIEVPEQYYDMVNSHYYLISDVTTYNGENVFGSSGVFSYYSNFISTRNPGAKIGIYFSNYYYEKYFG